MVVIEDRPARRPLISRSWAVRFKIFETGRTHMRKITTLAALIALSFGSTAHAQGILGQISGFLDKVSPKSSNTQIRELTPAMVSPSAEQVASTKNVIHNLDLPADTLVSYREAVPTIEMVVQTSACATNTSAWNRLNRINEKPGNYPSWSTSMIARAGDEYHDKGQCHDVLKITDVTKPAANAINFTAYYISPSSQAASRQNFTLLKDGSGSWVIRRIGDMR